MLVCVVPLSQPCSRDLDYPSGLFSTRDNKMCFVTNAVTNVFNIFLAHCNSLNFTVKAVY